MQDFRKLQVWRKAHEVTLTVYAATGKFPISERQRLASKMRRAAGAIGANIAEGCGRDSGPAFARFLHKAMGSANELENHNVLARDLKLLDSATTGDVMKKIAEVQRMLGSLISKVRATGERK